MLHIFLHENVFTAEKKSLMGLKPTIPARDAGALLLSFEIISLVVILY
jgi:hypothetical protein